MNRKKNLKWILFVDAVVACTMCKKKSEIWDDLFDISATDANFFLFDMMYDRLTYFQTQMCGW